MIKTASLENPDNLTENEKRAEINKMRASLSSIAGEIQKFEETSEEELVACATGPLSFDENENNLVELVKYKTKINSKRNRAQKLGPNLKDACFVADTVACARDEESGSLTHHLTCARTECADLLEKYKNNNKTLNSLSRENKILRTKLDNVSNFIQLGFRELQKMRHEYSTETSVLAQLKKLVVSCGEYYADYHNEHEKCLQLKQRNRFLVNKICIVEYNVKALSEQLKTLKYQNLKLLNDHRNKFQKSKPPNEINVAFSEVSKRLDESLCNAVEITKYKSDSGDLQDKLDPMTDFDLAPHLSIVKKLLNDQDTLIKDLKMLSEEFLNINYARD